MNKNTKVVTKTKMPDSFYSYGLVKKPHTELVGVVVFDSEKEVDYTCGFGECCDSNMAFMTDKELKEWFIVQKEIFESGDLARDLDYWTGTFVFDVDGLNFVIVSDCGGEGSIYEFESFCKERNIEVTFVIDGLYYGPEDRPEDIYCGGGDEDPKRLTALWSLYR